MGCALIIWGAYIVALSATASAALCCGRGGVVVAGATVFTLWAWGEVAVLIAGTVPVGFYLAIDLGALVMFWYVLSGTGARVFGATFAVQIALHLAYLVGVPASAMVYWCAHAATAFVQLAVLAGWLIVQRKTA